MDLMLTLGRTKDITAHDVKSTFNTRQPINNRYDKFRVANREVHTSLYKT